MKHVFLLGLCLLSMIAGIKITEGSPVLVTSRVALGGTDSVDWGVLGGAYTSISSPFIISSVGSVSVTVSQGSGLPFERRDQGVGWSGNFAPGDPLLWDKGNGPDITLDFGSNLVSAAGAQIQSNIYGGFVARITAYGPGLTFLGSFTETGTGTSDGDNSAIFIGISDSIATIQTIKFSLDTDYWNDFAINQVDFTSDPEMSVPEINPGRLRHSG